MVWYKKLSIYLLKHAMLKAFVLLRQSATTAGRSNKHFLEFMHSVIADLLLNADDENVDIDKDEYVIRLTGRHFPEKIAATARKQKPTKRCRVCYKKGTREESRFWCTRCPSKPALCIDECFTLYHTKIKYRK